MQLFIIFLIYNFFQILIVPFFSFYLLYRWVAGKIVFGLFKERMGWIQRVPKGKRVVWIHAVSVGEVLSVQYFIQELKFEIPNSIIYLTVGTSAGRQIANKKTQADFVSFLPYDFLPCMLFAFWRIHPSLIFIVEAEIWPNFLTLSSWFGIEKYSINARVSRRSFRRYQVLKFFFSPLFNSFEKIFTQSRQDKERFITLGVDPDKIKILGDIKTFNVVQKYDSCKKVNKQGSLNFQVLLVGSIHPGEFDFYSELFQKLKAEYLNLKMILVPRHFYWQNELEEKIKQLGLKYFLWRDQDNFFNANDSEIIKFFQSHDILVVCRMGELFNLYKFASIFFLGGTFVNVGGHNLLEPSVWAKPCIIGPYHQNTQVVADEIQAVGGLIKVKRFEQLLDETKKLLADYNLALQMGQKNCEWVIKQAKDVGYFLRQVIKRADL